MSTLAPTNPTGPNASTWKSTIAKYAQPGVGRSLWQVANTFVPYAALWYLMDRCFAISPWLTLLLAVPAAGLMVRIFIIFHDCVHGSFFKSRKANDALGLIAGVLTFTPYHQWRREHCIHHATSGDLDRRGTGDVPTLTVQEYLRLSRGKRFMYRMVRNPIVLFGVAPLFLFLIKHRLPSGGQDQRERHNLYATNLAIIALGATMCFAFGWRAYLCIQLPIVLLATAAGVWLFYVQHQFEDVYWEHRDNWDYLTAALQGSSFYRLPWLLRWFSGNIGFHHIHHLSPNVPNYNLPKCHREEPLFQTVKPLTIWTSLRSLTFRLWDEQQRKLVSFRHLKTLRSTAR